MFKRMTFLFTILFLVTPFIGEGSSEDVDNLLGNAYQLVVSGNLDKASENFASAADLALQEGHDRGIIESLRGLYVTGKSELSMKYAQAVVESSGSWRAVCGVGYLYASLKGMSEQATRAFFRSYKVASNQGDWYGMAESGRALFRIGQEKEALGCIESAEKVAELQKAYKRMPVLADIYRSMGEEAKALAVEEKVRLMAGPVPHVVDTLPGQEKISKESQQNISSQAESDIASDNAYIAQKMSQQEDKYYKSWMVITPFFSYLFFEVTDQYGYDGLSPSVVIAAPLINKWAGHHSSHYRLSPSGTYIYINVND